MAAQVAILKFWYHSGCWLIAADSLNASVADMRFVKPIDEAIN